VDIERIERGQAPIVEANFRPIMCNHCDNAPCIAASTNGAISKRADGIVIIDPVKAKGQKQLVNACPYNAIFWNEELEIPQAWTFDAHLIDQGWTKTRIDQCCPTGALKSVNVSDQEMIKLVNEEELEELRPALKTKPRVYYKNNHLFESVFLGGTLTRNIDGVEECLANINVEAVINDKVIATATTDCFGEFKLDRIQPSNNVVTIIAKDDQKTLLTMDASAEKSAYLGCFNVSAQA
jgi:Fe-S-cluster-containing dehydrogenase component